MPIINTGYKREAFLRNIARYLCGGNDHVGESAEGHEFGKTIYFGGGYWRGLWINERETGIELTNPDVSPAEARIVEQAMCILLLGEYQP